MLKLLKPWDSQPQGAAGPDLSHPANDRLAFLWSGSVPSIDQATGIQRTTDNTAKTVGVAGRAVTASTGQTNLEWASRNFITTSNGSGSGDFSILLIANPVGGASLGHMFAQKNDAGGTPFAQVAVLSNSATNATALNGSLCFFTYNAGTGTSSVAVTGQMDGNYHVWGFTRQGGNLYIDRDGVQVATVLDTVRTITQSAARYLAIGSRGNGTTESFDRDVAFAWAANRALTPQERAELGRSLLSPYQLFAPRSIWVPVSAGGAPAAFQAAWARNANTILKVA